jgi:hypothetical protein
MAAIEQELHERTHNASLSCPALPCSQVYIRFKNPKRRHFVSLCLTRKTPFRAAIALDISFRRHDIRHGRPVFGEPKSLMARAPENARQFRPVFTTSR